MEMTLPTGRSGRLTALGITAILLLLTWLLAIGPAIGLYADRQAKLERDQALLDRMQALSASLPTLRNQAKTLERSGRSAALTIVGNSDALAAAALQSMLQDMANSAGGTVTSFETVPAQAVGAYRRIGLKLTMHVPWNQLVAMLRAVEEAHPPMLIDELDIHSLGVLNLIATPKLDASFTVYAFRSGQETP